jgi:DUF4097 and DUF4098 domain-containing protein YvlB
MKSIKLIPLAFLIILSTYGYSQIDLSDYEDIAGVSITSYWGDIHVSGTISGDENEFYINANYTDTSNKLQLIDDLSQYISFEVVNKILYIQSRKPKRFESIDLKLNIPERLFLEITLLKGGNIYVRKFKNGVEINSLNGSVKLEQISKYALVNAANGEIDASFSNIDKNYPISLVTMNGGVKATLPENSKRDLRLISRKNGYIESDFSIDSNKEIINLNSKQYSKEPILTKARINGGGSLLFLSTENGPIAIKKLKA